jgi:hypothetical protein
MESETEFDHLTYLTHLLLRHCLMEFLAQIQLLPVHGAKHWAPPRFLPPASLGPSRSDSAKKIGRIDMYRNVSIKFERFRCIKNL